MTKMQNFLKFGRIFYVKLQTNPFGAWQHWFYPTSSKCGEVRSPHVAHKSFKNPSTGPEHLPLSSGLP
jgi:hypothetical protein